MYYTDYPYEIGYGWKVNNTPMNTVVDQLGSPTKKSTSATSTTLRSYEYSSLKIGYRFYSDSEDNYIGKKFITFSVF